MLIWILLSQLSSSSFFQEGSHVTSIFLLWGFLQGGKHISEAVCFSSKPNSLNRLCWISGSRKRRGSSASGSGEGGSPGVEASRTACRAPGESRRPKERGGSSRSEKTGPSLEVGTQAQGSGPLKSPMSQTQIRGNIDREQEHHVSPWQLRHAHDPWLERPSHLCPAQVTSPLQGGKENKTVIKFPTTCWGGLGSELDFMWVKKKPKQGNLIFLAHLFVD